MPSAKSLYSAWKRNTPDVGCLFARTIANRSDFYAQSIETVVAINPQRVASGIAQRITRLVQAPRTAAATLLFPNLTTLEQLATGLIALQGQPGWNVSFGELVHPKAGDLVTVAISRDIPFGPDNTVPSEALVFGPFVEFPTTRRAPIAALEIYVGRPRESDPKTGKPTVKANLAHLAMHLPSQDAFDNMWTRSMEGRLRSLGGEDDFRAKAKVAFVLPLALATKLGINQ